VDRHLFDGCDDYESSFSNWFYLGLVGGGWEYPILWSVLIFSFVLGGGRWRSLDEVISEHMTLPGWVTALMGDTVSQTRTNLKN